MNKKLQIFISSTFKDLEEEREKLVLSILKTRNIPSGMELSAGANEKTLSIIYEWIDESDVFVLLLGGKYGSICPGSNMSFTELEYEYAKSKSKPIVVLSLTEKYLDKKLKEKDLKSSDLYEKQNMQKMDQFKVSATGSNYSIMINDISEIDSKLYSAMDSIKNKYSLQGWIKVNEAFDDILGRFIKYSNMSARIIRDNNYYKDEIEELLLTLCDIVKRYLAPDIGWIDVMIPLSSADSKTYDRLMNGIDEKVSVWLKVVYTDVRRTNPPRLIPTSILGKSWRGSGTAFSVCGIDYVSSFKDKYEGGKYDISENQEKEIIEQYNQWSSGHHFSSILAVGISANSRDHSASIGVLNLNFRKPSPFGDIETIEPELSRRLCELLDPCIDVLRPAIIKGRIG